MQYNQDVAGPFAELFTRVRKILLGIEGVKEKKSEHHTSYLDSYQSIIHLKTHKDKLIIAFAKGGKLQEQYPFLKGEGKVVRHLHLTDMKDLDEKLLKEMIEETMILNTEAHKMRQLKKSL